MLIVTLFSIVFAAILVIGLFVLTENRTRTSSLNVSVLDTDIVSESALNLVQAQIKEATSRGVNASGKGTETWASQPGALRTYDNLGVLTEVYKLYSSDTMQTTSTTFSAADLPADWESRKDEFVDLNEPVSRRGNWIYPIANPDSLAAVAGFSSSRTDNGSTSWDDRLAMPVRWLYLTGSGTLTTDSTVADPVARIAFWTDDESCKINVNTASATNAKSYWDIPRATLKYDVSELAIKQPAQNEYNRYPGHPANVSLSTVFPDPSNPTTPSNAWIKTLIETTPRYQWGGSENGTITIDATRTPINNSKQDRLYATIDEYLYNPNRAVQLGLTEAKLDEARFFLTASSRSSELNLFGQPRVTIWPVHATDDTLHRTAFDQLIARCSTIGATGSERKYYFVRSNSQSQTADWTNQSGNQDLFAYLQTLTASDIPGFGGNFRQKYDIASGGVTGERDQILTEIFDHIRCTNLNETYSGMPPAYEGFTTMLRDATGTALTFGRSGSDQSTFAGAGFVLPINIPSIGRGAGRVPVISEVGIWLIQTVDDINNLPAVPMVQPGIIIETNTPMQGLMPWQPYLRSVEIAASPGNPLPKINGVPIWTGSSLPSNYGPNAGISGSQSLGGTNGWAWLSNAANTFGTNPLFTPTANAIPAPSGSVTITPGEFMVNLKSDGVTFQTYHIKVPAASLPVPDPVQATPIPSGNMAGREGWIKRQSTSNYQPSFLPEDVVQSIALIDGDARIAACLQDVPVEMFKEHQDFGLQRFAHGFRTGFGGTDNGSTNGKIVNLAYGSQAYSTRLADGNFLSLPRLADPDIPAGITSLRSKNWEGDFDNGYGPVIDGGYMGKSDEGALTWKPGAVNEAEAPPYFAPYWTLGDGLFSPLRQMPSAVVFGSLPTGVKRTVAAYTSGTPAQAAPWRTLVFCPNPANPNHFGLVQDPPDHLLLDLFTMPVVEPYAISEPFSTAGRLNMNCAIVPFSYIKRYTPMHAALASQKIVAIPDSAAGIYKSKQPQLANDSIESRLPVDIDKTLEQWETKFASGEIFKSASEICEQFLVPVGTTLATAKSTWWNDYKLTGDNSRERPYATLYPLLTTRSSTYTMHFRAQAVRRLPNGEIAVTAEKRGSQLFERYLDPNDSAIGVGKIDPNQKSLEPYFRFRTLLTKRFDP